MHELMGWSGPMTYRQYLAWNQWLELQWNIPSRDNYYQMLIAQQVTSGLVKNPKSLKLDQFKIPFKAGKTKPRKKWTAQEWTEIAQMRWQPLIALAKLREERERQAYGTHVADTTQVPTDVTKIDNPTNPIQQQSGQP